MKNQAVIVVSAISLRSGGTFSILEDCLNELNRAEYSDFKIYALVKDKKLFSHTFERIELIELDGTTSYIKRLYLEYLYFRGLSRKLNPYLWLSLHDITPNVIAEKRAVYCHQPSTFYALPFREFLLDPKIGVFKLLYRYLYRINIHKNEYVIIQQDWIRNFFNKQFSIGKEKIIVAHPRVNFELVSTSPARDEQKLFIYPTLPRVFKNVELVCKAALLLKNRGIKTFKVLVTISGEENIYARWIKWKFGCSPNVDFIGLQPRATIFNLYGKVDYLLFPSKLETWGLPISEFKQTGKPMLIADLPYAHETVGNYDKVDFFNPYHEIELADKMQAVITGSTIFHEHVPPKIAEPMTHNWQELFSVLLKEKRKDSL